MKKTLPFSMFAILLVLPVIADPITNESMCIIDALNTSTNNSDANVEAIWTAQSFSCPEGQYLEADNVTCTTCPENYFCRGFTNETFADADIGIDACSSEGSGVAVGPYSEAGTNKPQLCYAIVTRTCAEQNPLTVPHGTVTYANQSVTTREYFDVVYIPNDTLGCAATVSCDTGYTATQKGPLADYVNIQVLNYDDNYYRLKSNSGTYTRGNNADTLSAGSWEIKWKNNTTVSGISSCNSTRNDIMYYLEEFAENNITAEQMMTGLYSVATAEQMARIQELLTQYQSGDLTVLEVAAITNKEFNVNTSAQFTQNSTGTNCWCKMTGYTLTGQNTVDTTSNAGWVWKGEFNDSSTCANNCAPQCEDATSYWHNYRAAIIGVYGEYPTCNPNTINLNWYLDENATTPLTVDAAAQQCTYGQPITLPSTEPTKTGYVFSGWRLRQTVQNNNN